MVIGRRVVEPRRARRGVVLQRGREAGRHRHQMANGHRAFLFRQCLGPATQVIGDRIVERQQPPLLRHANQDGNDAFLHRGDIFDRMTERVRAVAPVRVPARRGFQRPVAFGQNASAVEDDDAGRIPFPGEGQRRIEPLGVPAGGRRIDCPPGPFRRRKVKRFSRSRWRGRRRRLTGRLRRRLGLPIRTRTGQQQRDNRRRSAQRQDSRPHDDRFPQRTSRPSRTQTSSPTVTVVSVKKFQRT